MDSQVTYWQVVFPYKRLTLNFIIFYAVGLFLFIFPQTRELFISLIPLSLLLVIGVVLLSHKIWNKVTVICFTSIVVASFLYEMAGTNTGEIFGVYFYDRGLGFQIVHTPLIIGFNWLFLVYASHDIVSRFISKAIWRILGGSLLMILYDIVLEWVAPVMRMWHFNSGYPPLKNFVAWFVAAIIFHSAFEFAGIQTKNLASTGLFFIQLLFFIVIGLYSYLFIL